MYDASAWRFHFYPLGIYLESYPEIMTSAQVSNRKRRIVVLNAFPLSAFAGNRVTVDLIHAGANLAKLIREMVGDEYEVVSYVRHVSTVEALKRMGLPIGGPNAGVYRYEPGDVLVIAVLKNPMRGVNEVEVKEEDLDIWVANPLM
jgi:hypothetical protein